MALKEKKCDGAAQQTSFSNIPLAVIEQEEKKEKEIINALNR